MPPGTDGKQGAPLDCVITHGLYTHALWQLPEPLKLVNFFEDDKARLRGL